MSSKSEVKGDAVNYIYKCVINGVLYAAMPKIDGEGYVLKEK